MGAPEEGGDFQPLAPGTGRKCCISPNHLLRDGVSEMSKDSLLVAGTGLGVTSCVPGSYFLERTYDCPN